MYRSLIRLAGAVGMFGETVAHVPVIEDHLTEAPYIGVGFVLLAVIGLVLGTLWTTGPGTPAIETFVVTVLAIAGFVLSRTVGLPMIGDDVGNWSEPLGVVALAAESLALSASVAWMVDVARRIR